MRRIFGHNKENSICDSLNGRTEHALKPLRQILLIKVAELFPSYTVNKAKKRNFNTNSYLVCTDIYKLGYSIIKYCPYNLSTMYSKISTKGKSTNPVLQDTPQTAQTSSDHSQMQQIITKMNQLEDNMNVIKTEYRTLKDQDMQKSLKIIKLEHELDRLTDKVTILEYDNIVNSAPQLFENLPGVVPDTTAEHPASTEETATANLSTSPQLPISSTPNLPASRTGVAITTEMPTSGTAEALTPATPGTTVTPTSAPPDAPVLPSATAANNSTLQMANLTINNVLAKSSCAHIRDFIEGNSKCKKGSVEVYELSLKAGYKTFKALIPNTEVKKIIEAFETNNIKAEVFKPQKPKRSATVNRNNNQHSFRGSASNTGRRQHYSRYDRSPDHYGWREASSPTYQTQPPDWYNQRHQYHKHSAAYYEQREPNRPIYHQAPDWRNPQHYDH